MTHRGLVGAGCLLPDVSCELGDPRHAVSRPSPGGDSPPQRRGDAPCLLLDAAFVRCAPTPGFDPGTHRRFGKRSRVKPGTGSPSGTRFACGTAGVSGHVSHPRDGELEHRPTNLQHLASYRAPAKRAPFRRVMSATCFQHDPPPFWPVANLRFDAGHDCATPRTGSGTNGGMLQTIGTVLSFFGSTHCALFADRPKTHRGDQHPLGPAPETSRRDPVVAAQLLHCAGGHHVTGLQHVEPLRQCQRDVRGLPRDQRPK